MSRTDFLISCPFCRRQYQMKLDREEITRKKTRATCGRCGNTFELAARIALPGAGAMAPSAATPRRPSTSTRKAQEPTAKQAEDLANLTREIAEAAAQIAVPLVEPASASELLSEDPYAQYEQETAAPEPASAASPMGPPPHGVIRREANDVTATAEIVAHAALAQTASTIAATGAGATETAETAATDSDSALRSGLDAVAVVPRTWIKLSDPGLAGLSRAPSAVVLVLEHLLH